MKQTLGERELMEMRDMKVVKANETALSTRYDFSVFEQKMISYLCSLIKPVALTNEEKEIVRKAEKTLGTRHLVHEEALILEYPLRLRDIIDVFGMPNSGQSYKACKEALESLEQKVMYLTKENGEETTVRWINKLTYNADKSQVLVELDRDMSPYLFQLQRNYFWYYLHNVLCMRNDYSIHLFELLKANHDLLLGRRLRGVLTTAKKLEIQSQTIHFRIPIEEIKTKLMLENKPSYREYKALRRRVLMPAINEINDKTDINVAYETIYNGNKAEAIEFHITPKTMTETLMVSAGKGNPDKKRNRKKSEGKPEIARQQSFSETMDSIPNEATTLPDGMIKSREPKATLNPPKPKLKHVDGFKTLGEI